ncbi:MAG: branched-chain amino acid ABC transporter permease, partial [Deltaproteobacteria bacterium]|nr:branched-chain amino acid ABC transporter permease [Deltaproteobacteria bacterium]
MFLAALPGVAQILDQPYLLSLFSRILIYALAAVSLDLLLGVGGLISLGHAAYLGIGAYVVGIFFQHGMESEPILAWPFLIQGSENALVVWPAAVIVSALLAFMIGALCLRTRGMHFIMITLAFAQMFYYFFVSLEKYGGDDGLSLYSRNTLPGLDLGNDLHFYYVCLFFLAVFLVLAVRLSRSRFGLVLRGAKENDRRVNALGINTYWYKLTCFVIAGAGAGLAGALLANQTEFVSPGLLHWTLSGELMVMVLLGGMGTLYGPVAGAALFLLLEEGLAMYTEHWMFFMGLILVLVVV